METLSSLFGPHPKAHGMEINMKDGSMFHDLVNFKKKSYYRGHQNIAVYTPDKVRKYIMESSAFAADAYTAGINKYGKQLVKVVLKIICNMKVLNILLYFQLIRDCSQRKIS